jgi:hypothetical protein
MNGPEPQSRSARYRAKAAEFRARSEGALTEDMRGFYALLAKDFDRMADEAEQAEKLGELEPPA